MLCACTDWRLVQKNKKHTFGADEAESWQHLFTNTISINPIEQISMHCFQESTLASKQCHCIAIRKSFQFLEKWNETLILLIKNGAERIRLTNDAIEGRNKSFIVESLCGLFYWVTCSDFVWFFVYSFYRVVVCLIVKIGAQPHTQNVLYLINFVLSTKEIIHTPA